MKTKREAVVNRLKQLQTDCLPILQLLEDQELVKQLRADKKFTLENLQAEYQVSVYHCTLI
jgi:hypothetical protein